MQKTCPLCGSDSVTGQACTACGSSWASQQAMGPRVLATRTSFGMTSAQRYMAAGGILLIGLVVFGLAERPKDSPVVLVSSQSIPNGPSYSIGSQAVSGERMAESATGPNVILGSDNSLASSIPAQSMPRQSGALPPFTAYSLPGQAPPNPNVPTDAATALAQSGANSDLGTSDTVVQQDPSSLFSNSFSMTSPDGSVNQLNLSHDGYGNITNYRMTYDGPEGSYEFVPDTQPNRATGSQLSLDPTNPYTRVYVDQNGNMSLGEYPSSFGN